MNNVRLALVLLLSGCATTNGVSLVAKGDGKKPLMRRATKASLAEKQSPEYYQAPCSVQDGSGASSAYPCSCGYAPVTCRLNQRCDGQSDTCEASIFKNMIMASMEVLEQCEGAPDAPMALMEQGTNDGIDCTDDNGYDVRGGATAGDARLMDTMFRAATSYITEFALEHCTLCAMILAESNNLQSASLEARKGTRASRTCRNPATNPPTSWADSCVDELVEACSPGNPAGVLEACAVAYACRTDDIAQSWKDEHCEDVDVTTVGCDDLLQVTSARNFSGASPDKSMVERGALAKDGESDTSVSLDDSLAGKQDAEDCNCP